MLVLLNFTLMFWMENFLFFRLPRFKAEINHMTKSMVPKFIDDYFSSLTKSHWWNVCSEKFAVGMTSSNQELSSTTLPPKYIYRTDNTTTIPPERALRRQSLTSSSIMHSAHFSKSKFAVKTQRNGKKIRSNM